MLATLLVSGVLLYVKAQSQAYVTDPNSLCRTDRPPSEVVVLLLDMSDEFTEPQILQIRNELDRLVRGVPQFASIEVYSVDPSAAAVIHPVFHICNPGTGSDMDPLYQNPELAKQRWQAFVSRLGDQISVLMKQPESQTSPIFEAIQATALRTFDRAEYDGVAKRLIVVSDLLQNVPGKMVQYHGTPSFEEFRRSSYFTEVRADLSQVAVTVLYLVRPKPQKWPEHYRFWEQYFTAQGATVEAVDPIYGAR